MARPESGGVVDPAARDKYLLQVTAGPSYDTSTHREVTVNGTDAHMIENDVMTCWLKVRIRDYHGLPRGSPSTSNYFEHPLHTSDRYSIGFSFIPKKDIKGNDLVTGFDFDHSIKDRLPPGFRYAMKIVTTILDPGIYSDPYSDKPYLYGPGLSSFFSFRIGEHTSEASPDEQLAVHDSDFRGVIEEGADGSGQRIRADQQIPAKTSKRRKNFLSPNKLENFTFEAGRMYQADFFNPYLDFANFALRIPGFSISVVRYIDDKTHQLRFVLKNRSTEEVLFVVIFTLLYGQKLEDVLEKRDRMDEREAQSTPSGSETPESLSRPQTSSSNETPAASSRSTPSSSAPESDVEDADRETRAERATTASMLANSIYSGFAALGFGRKRKEPRKTLDDKVDELDEVKMGEYLKAKSAHA
ncbi:DUF1769-domain-containing protein [Trematosphaeria pertusa]|uniref:DUF1769-domain-containing protein n=1 Tax=Trematosphaeria pertusa TaxID=390896 RepID=A0A6A6IJ20_9PLEO|nr:DUF1769-domain-containing protein [Trematosphaeria pertusa]KAF2250219.1 DUF1769-domain-containing protein [Trematosphaeria pertusa]